MAEAIVSQSLINGLVLIIDVLGHCHKLSNIFSLVFGLFVQPHITAGSSLLLLSVLLLLPINLDQALLENLEQIDTFKAVCLHEVHRK